MADDVETLRAQLKNMAGRAVVAERVLAKLINEAPEYVNFGHEYEQPFLSIDTRVELTEAELALVVGLEANRG